MTRSFASAGVLALALAGCGGGEDGGDDGGDGGDGTTMTLRCVVATPDACVEIVGVASETAQNDLFAFCYGFNGTPSEGACSRADLLSGTCDITESQVVPEGYEGTVFFGAGVAPSTAATVCGSLGGTWVP